MSPGCDAIVVLPVYNEARTVGSVLAAVRRVHQGPILVVDDGSTDDTVRVLSDIARRLSVTVLTHDRNSGYGRSLQDAFAHALDSGCEAVITMDCDGQHEPEHIPDLLRVLEGCDIASGSRYLPESEVLGMAPAERQSVNRHVTQHINAVTGWSLTDAFCGFKAYRTEVLRRLTLTEPGYGMPLELWAKAYRAGLKVVEFPVPRIYFDGDRSFGQELDDPVHRLQYYMRVWQRALTGDDRG